MLCVITGLSVLATACAPVSAVAFPLLMLAGFFSIWLIALANTLVQIQPEPHFRGRVMGLWTMVLPGLSPVTGIAVGAVTQLLGPREGFGMAGVALGVAAVLGWRALGAHDRRTASAQASAEREQRIELSYPEQPAARVVGEESGRERGTE